jgi:hypothetical protein
MVHPDERIDDKKIANGPVSGGWVLTGKAPTNSPISRFPLQSSRHVALRTIR